MLRDIHFYGPLAKTVGHDKLRLDANDVKMLFRAMECAKSGFTQHVAAFNNIAFVLKNGDKTRALRDDDLSWNFGDYPEVHIAAGEDGAGIEAALIAWGVNAALAATLTTIAINIAVSAVIGVIVSSMADTPTTNNNESVDERKSYLFNGAENSTMQGGPIPLVYGQFRVGSVLISSDVTTEKLASASDDTMQIDEGNSISGNVLTNDISGSTATTVVSFKVGATTVSAGGLYTAPGSLWTLTIAANGNWTITTVDGSGSPTWDPTVNVATYTTSNGDTAKLSIQIKDVEAVPVYIETYGDGG